MVREIVAVNGLLEGDDLPQRFLRLQEPSRQALVDFHAGRFAKALDAYPACIEQFKALLQEASHSARDEDRNLVSEIQYNSVVIWLI